MPGESEGVSFFDGSRRSIAEGENSDPARRQVSAIVLSIGALGLLDEEETPVRSAQVFEIQSG